MDVPAIPKGALAQRQEVNGLTDIDNVSPQSFSISIHIWPPNIAVHRPFHLQDSWVIIMQ